MEAPEARECSGVVGDRGRGRGVDCANGCLFTEMGKWQGLAKVAGEEHPDALVQAGKPNEAPAEILGEEPSECAVPEDVEELDEKKLLEALTAEQLVANAHAGEQASASVRGSGNSGEAVASKRASYRRLAA